MIGGAKGIGIGIDFGIPNQYCRATSKPYIEKDVLDSLRVVASAYGKSNDDADRSIVKNLVDASNPFIISNAAFKLNSGFGKYSADFESFDWAVNISQKQHNKATISLNGRLCNHTAIEIDEMKVNIIGNVTELIYWYIANPDDTTRSEIRLTSGINTLPKSYAKDDGQTYNIGFAYISGDSEITIEQIPSFEGAFVTDGIDDLITSTKTVQEMLGGSNEITVVSMIHQVKDSVNNVSFTNYIRGSANGYSRNIVNNYDKTGIYGYTSSDLMGLSVVNNILGDKNDYTANGDNRDSIINGNFSVQGYSYNDGNNTGDFSSVAWYWTIIANKVLTTDQINQVIAYFNLDRTLKPDIRCNIERQGITNDNHADFNDRLIDYSGNGRDIQMYNLAWKGGSGIAAKPFETIKDYTIVSDEARQKLTIYNEFSYKIKSNTPSYYWTVQSIIRDNTSYQVTIITDKDCYWINATSFINSEGNKESIRKKYPVLANTPTQVIICGLDQFEYPEGIEPTNAVSYVNLEYAGEITITFIPSCKGGILLDGINDFGKVIDMPIYKDYTFIIDRQIISIGDTAGIVASKSEDSTDVNKQGAFLFEYLGTPNNISAWSFYKDNGKVANTDFTRGISYQSTYSYNGKDLTVGTSKDSDKLWLGTIRDRDSRFFNGAIYSLMSFPYSMSEFLIERQLKKYKLGTLYPNMVEFRPIVKSNSEYQVVDCYIDTLPAVVGNYYPINSKLRIAVTTKGAADEVTSLTVNGVSLGTPSVNGNRFNFNGTLSDKSPQKINITIYQPPEYLTMLNNETLISNETLIKNE